MGEPKFTREELDVLVHNLRTCRTYDYPRIMERAANAIEALRAAADAPMGEARKWRPIKTAPKDGTRILLADSKNVVTGYWSPPGNGWLCDWVVGTYGDKPTRWMPLPAPESALDAAKRAIPGLDAVLAEAASPPPEEAAEPGPVAWYYSSVVGGVQSFTNEPSVAKQRQKDGWHVTPLYAAPPLNERASPALPQAQYESALAWAVIVLQTNLEHREPIIRALSYVIEQCEQGRHLPADTGGK